MIDRKVHSHRVRYYETDLMGVVHHSNYLRFLEEARVEWLRQKEIAQYHYPHAPVTIAVLETQVRHLKPAYLEDDLQIHMQVHMQGLKIRFQYAIYSERFGSRPICTAETLHIPVNNEFKVCRLPEGLIQALEKEQWTETWLSSLSESQKPQP